MKEEELKARIQKLEAENEALRNKTAPSKEHKFPVVDQYDIATLVSVEDIVSNCSPPAHLDALSKGDVRSVIRLFGLDAVFQHKTKDKGRGTLLYSRDVIDEVLEVVANSSN